MIPVTMWNWPWSAVEGLRSCKSVQFNLHCRVASVALYIPTVSV